MKITKRQLRKIIMGCLLTEGNAEVLKHDKIHKYVIELKKTDDRRKPYLVSVIKLGQGIGGQGVEAWLSKQLMKFTEPVEDERSFRTLSKATGYYDAMVRTFLKLATKRQRRRELRRTTAEAIDFSGREANPHGGEMYGEPEGGYETPYVDQNRAYELIVVLQEFGYELFLPHARDSNQAAVNDALAAYPGEFTYDDLREAIRIVQGRGA